MEEEKYKVKKGKLILSIIFLVFLLNLFIFIKSQREGKSLISGMFLDNLQIPFDLNLSIVAFVAQWVVLILIVLIAYSRFLKHRKEEESKQVGITMPQNLSKSETEIDVLYRILQEKKSLSVGTIAKTFGITKEKAIEWAKILEDNDLATVEYPAFNDPQVEIKGFDEEKDKK